MKELLESLSQQHEKTTKELEEKAVQVSKLLHESDQPIILIDNCNSLK